MIKKIKETIMKIMKKSLLALALITSSIALPYHGDGGGFGGGFATGAILGTGLTLAATSGRNEDPATRNIKSIDKDIRYEQRQLERANRDYKKGKINGAELDRTIRQHESNLNSLRRSRVEAAA
jgi:hypothetical protein